MMMVEGAKIAVDLGKKVLVVNGPNLNLLGIRKKEIYGGTTLPQIVADLELQALSLKLELSHVQLNGEGEIVTTIHNARDTVDGIIINAGGYSHTSIAIRDALECFPGPIIEVHLSNIAAREEFRRHSFVSEVARGVIFGLGPLGYRLALQGMSEIFSAESAI